MAYYCPQCGSEMVLEDDGDVYCDNCMCYYGLNNPDDYSDPNWYLRETDENIGDLDPGPGCRACGNPVYPNCIDSCPLMDD